MKKDLKTEQNIQESEYTIPYHYIPSLDNHSFSQTLHWSWGMRYLGGIELVLSEMRKIKFGSLLDVGCGDGRFLREVCSRFDSVKTRGVDYSKNAIALASALNPDINYDCIDITENTHADTYDVVTMVEVLEHIPIADVSAFLSSVSRLLNCNGKLILTVPHINKTVSTKHFQHFSSDSLLESLSPHFQVEKVVPFDRLSRFTDWLIRLLGGEGENYVVTNKKINSLVYKRVLKSCLNPVAENNCCRLLAVASLKGKL